MRVRVIFRLKNRGSVLPFHHQKVVASLMTEMLIGSKYKLEELSFNYSGLKGQTKVGREGLFYLSNRVTLVMASSDDEFLFFLLDQIFLREQLLLGNLILEPEYVEQEIVDLTHSPIKYLSISPIVVYNSEDNHKNKEFIYPTTDQFSDLLYDSTMGRIEKGGYFSDEKMESFYKFQIIPDKFYLQRLTKQEKKFARIYTISVGHKVKEIRGYTFPFLLYAAPEVQKFIFENGFGEFTYFGFGMLDIADADSLKSLEPIERFDKR